SQCHCRWMGRCRPYRRLTQHKPNRKMATQAQELQAFIRHYKQQTGETEVDMHKVAALALKMGMEPPKPVSPTDLLAKKFSKAAREEMRTDRSTGLPYRVNHPFSADGTGQMMLWVDIDEAPRKHMVKSATHRR